MVVSVFYFQMIMVPYGHQLAWLRCLRGSNQRFRLDCENDNMFLKVGSGLHSVMAR